MPAKRRSRNECSGCRSRAFRCLPSVRQRGPRPAADSRGGCCRLSRRSPSTDRGKLPDSVIDAIASWHAGTVYNGFIFAESSPRYVTPQHERQIVSACRSSNCAQKFVGVFVNDTIENITDLAVSIPLAAVQLHGSESIEFVKELRKELPKNCEIWKAIPVENEYPALIVNEYLKEVNRVVLDTKNNSGFGGTGASFDWSLITANRSRIIVAGGLNPNNILEARDISKAVGFDLNSGVEESAGIKDIEKINTVFGKLKDF